MAKTIFIIGAGASSPYGFPLGGELVDSIINKSKYKIDRSNRIDVTPNYLGGLITGEFKTVMVDSFRKYLKESGTNSIDSFVSENKQFMAIGKACIAYILLECENKYGYNSKLGGDWYNYFSNILTTEDPDNFDFKIYTFNYDRSLEHFLRIKAESFFVNNKEKQEKFLKNIPIIHLHGSLGNIRFGNIVQLNNYDYLEQVASNIKIISEVDSDENFEMVKNDIISAKNVFFLGFGFHPDNMKRLGFIRRTELKHIQSLPTFSCICLWEGSC